MRVVRGGLLCILTLGLAVAGAEGQQRAQGWIGISFDIESRRGQGARVVIIDVSEGSPAEAAGLREGDRLLAVNDLRRTRELAELSERLRLRPGDDVKMTILRDGRRRNVEMTAARRPSMASVGTTFSMTFEPDSLSEAMFKAMDSLRLRFSDAQNTTVRVRTSADPDESYRIVNSTGVGAGPFEFFVFRGEEYDSLQREMSELNRFMESLEREYETRVRELERRGARRPERDATVRSLQREIEESSRRTATLRASMAEAAGLRPRRATPRSRSHRLHR